MEIDDGDEEQNDSVMEGLGGDSLDLWREEAAFPLDAAAPALAVAEQIGPEEAKRNR